MQHLGQHPKLRAHGGILKQAVVSFLCVVMLAACGTDNNESASSVKPNIACETGQISGAGSTFVQNIIQQWIKQYLRTCPGSSIDYKGIGSGGGIQQFTAGTVDFAGSDVVMKASELSAAQQKRGTVVQLPWSSGGIAVMYKIDSLPDLQLSGSTLAQIFAGKIKKWNDQAIQADNPGRKLPSLTIQAVHRSDGSGTTEAFTQYLTAVAPEVWTYGAAKDVPWPTGQGAKGSDGVTAVVKSAEGTVGYVEASYAQANTLGVAKIKNNVGTYVAPSAESVKAALGEAKLGSDLKVSINYKTNSPDAYPIATVTYVIAPKSPSDPAKAKMLNSFITYALQDGQKEAERLFYAPLPQSMIDKALTVAQGVGK